MCNPDEIERLEKLNANLSKALAYEMASNFSQAHLRAHMEEKIEKIEELFEGTSYEVQVRRILDSYQGLKE